MKKAARNKKESFFEKAQEEVKQVVVEEEKVLVKPTKKIFQRRPVQIAAFLVVAIILGILGYIQLSKLRNSTTFENGKLSNEEIKNLVGEVGDKIMIPNGETPTIATVTDITKLSGQPFFKDAQNGDKVIIFGSTKEAILYRTSIHKIISVAPINQAVNASPTPVQNVPTGQVSGTPPVSPTPSKSVGRLKVMILNSTKTAGLAKKAAALMDPGKADIKTGNAVGEYDITTVSNVAKDKVADADLKTFAGAYTKIKATVSPLPKGEVVSPDADVVIILGKDFAEGYK